MSDKKRITFFLDSLGMGGAENVAVSLSNFLINYNFDVRFLSLNNKNNVLFSSVNKMVKIDDLNAASARQSIFSLVRYCKENQPPVFVVFHYQIAVILIILRLLRVIPKTKIIVRNVSTLSIRLSQAKSFWSAHVVKIFLKLFYRYADGFIAQSEGMKDDLVNEFSVPNSKITR